MDSFWIILTVLFFLFLNRPYLRFLIPLLFVISILINYSALAFFNILYFIILLYRTAIERSKKEKHIYGGIFSFSLVITLIVFVFFLLLESQKICPVEIFHSKLQEHGCSYYIYYDYAFYHIIDGKNFIPDFVYNIKPFLLKLIYLVYYQVKVNFTIMLSNVESSIIATISGLILFPLLFIFFSFHKQRFIEQNNKLQRFCTFLMIIQFPFMFFLGLIFATSVDITRYISYAFTISFVCVLTVLYYEDNQRELFFKKNQALTNSTFAFIFILGYSTITLSPSL